VILAQVNLVQWRWLWWWSVSAVEKGKGGRRGRGGGEESGESCDGTVRWLVFSLVRFIGKLGVR